MQEIYLGARVPLGIKKEFERVAVGQERTASGLIRYLIKQELERHEKTKVKMTNDL